MSHDGKGVFAGLPRPFEAGRYHSLVIARDGWPEALEPCAHAEDDGVVMGVNYGFEKVRFINPVKVGSRIRSNSVLSKVELKDPNTIHTTSTVTVEIEGESKPAVVAEWVTRLVYG